MRRNKKRTYVMDELLEEPLDEALLNMINGKNETIPMLDVTLRDTFREAEREVRKVKASLILLLIGVILISVILAVAFSARAAEGQVAAEIVDQGALYSSTRVYKAGERQSLYLFRQIGTIEEMEKRLGGDILEIRKLSDGRYIALYEVRKEY